MTTPEGSTNNASNGSRDLPSDSLEILQLSDPHLFADPEGRLLGMRTLPSFRHVIAHASKNLPSIDLALVTGDLVHDASPAGYSLLKKELANLGIPSYCLPGNHDSPEILHRSITGNPVDTPFSIQKKGWSIILLDSNLPGHTAGYLDEIQLAKLQDTLSNHPDHHTLICLHHHTVAIKSQWIDAIMLSNANDFFAIIDCHPQIKGIACGHVHQSFEGRRNGVLLMGTPSTCFQFTPKSAGFEIDNKTPGYRHLTLLADGGILTSTFHLSQYTYSIDRSSSGY